MRTVWLGYRGVLYVYDYGSEAPDLCFSSDPTSDSAVLFQRPFRISAYASGHATPIPIFPTGLKLVQMDAESVELEIELI